MSCMIAAVLSHVVYCFIYFYFSFFIVNPFSVLVIFLLKIVKQPFSFFSVSLFTYYCGHQASFCIGDHTVKLMYPRFIILKKDLLVLKNIFWNIFFDGCCWRWQIHYF